MKVLVYGSGVIGSYLAHVLWSAGNDVMVLARGVWKQHLEKNGLTIRHHLQRKVTRDHPKVIGDISEDDIYNAVLPTCCGAGVHKRFLVATIITT